MDGVNAAHKARARKSFGLNAQFENERFVQLPINDGYFVISQNHLNLISDSLALRLRMKGVSHKKILNEISYAISKWVKNSDDFCLECDRSFHSKMNGSKYKKSKQKIHRVVNAYMKKLSDVNYSFARQRISEAQSGSSSNYSFSTTFLTSLLMMMVFALVSPSAANGAAVVRRSLSSCTGVSDVVESELARSQCQADLLTDLCGVVSTQVGNVQTLISNGWTSLQSVQRPASGIFYSHYQQSYLSVHSANQLLDDLTVPTNCLSSIGDDSSSGSILGGLAQVRSSMDTVATICSSSLWCTNYWDWGRDFNILSVQTPINAIEAARTQYQSDSQVLNGLPLATTSTTTSSKTTTLTSISSTLVSSTTSSSTTSSSTTSSSTTSSPTTLSSTSLTPTIVITTTVAPTEPPTSPPTISPSGQPTEPPTSPPTVSPSAQPTDSPTSSPTVPSTTTTKSTMVSTFTITSSSSTHTSTTGSSTTQRSSTTTQSNVVITTTIPPELTTTLTSITPTSITPTSITPTSTTTITPTEYTTTSSVTVNGITTPSTTTINVTPTTTTTTVHFTTPDGETHTYTSTVSTSTLSESLTPLVPEITDDVQNVTRVDLGPQESNVQGASAQESFPWRILGYVVAAVVGLFGLVALVKWALRTESRMNTLPDSATIDMHQNPLFDVHNNVHSPQIQRRMGNPAYDGRVYEEISHGNGGYEVPVAQYECVDEGVQQTGHLQNTPHYDYADGRTGENTARVAQYECVDEGVQQTGHLQNTPHYDVATGENILESGYVEPVPNAAVYHRANDTSGGLSVPAEQRFSQYDIAVSAQREGDSQDSRVAVYAYMEGVNRVMNSEYDNSISLLNEESHPFGFGGSEYIQVGDMVPVSMYDNVNSNGDVLSSPNLSSRDVHA